MSEVGQVYYQQKWWEGTALTGKHMPSLKRAARTAPPLNSKQKYSLVVPEFSGLPPKFQKSRDFIEKCPNFSMLITSWNLQTPEIKQNTSLRWFSPEGTSELTHENCFQQVWGGNGKKLRLWGQTDLGLNGWC